MSSTVLSSNQSLIQNIKFSGSESEYVAEICGQVINVQCGEGNHNHGSSKVKLSDRIDYIWEFKYYHGHLVAAHINGKIIAYAMKGKEGGMIRVTNYEANTKRALIKNFKEDIKDLSFAYSRTEYILGCIDYEGNILIYNIEDNPDSLTYTLLLHIFHEEPARPKTNFRLIWCPYLPSYDDDVDASDDPEKMFVVLNGRRAEIYNVVMLNNKYGNETALDPDDSFEGYIEIDHSSDLIDAAFSSDGTAIAIACQDGYVKFFQLYMLDPEKQKCLHEWQPHGGQPLTSIIFIDNILEYSSECWKFTITGASNNSEIKLWSCETWTCLQTIHFNPNPKGVIKDLFLNLSIDYTGRYLVVSDINNRAIYVMQLKRNDEEQSVCVPLLCHFLLPAPFLSFHILEACARNIPYCYNNSTEDLFDNEDDFDEESEIAVLSLKMLVIQPKKFQECNVTFQPEALMYKGVTITENVVEQLIDIKNEDEEDDEEEEEEEATGKIPELDDLQSSVSLLIQQQQQQQQSSSKLTLMTPDDFTSSPGKNSKSSSLRNSTTNENPANEPVDKLSETSGADFQRPQRDNFASAGSSPSREVQEILSLNTSGSAYPTQEYFNNLANLQVEDEQERPQKDYSAQAENDAVAWPKIPLVKDPAVAEEESGHINKQDLETVYMRINALEGMMQQLHRDLKALNQTVGRTGPKITDKEEFVKDLDAAMSKQHLQIAKMLENLANLQKAKEREMQEQMVSAVTQILTKVISEKVQQVVQHEIKLSVLPSIHNLVEAYRHQIDSQYGHKFSNIDNMVKDNFAKVMSSKSLMDSISASVVNLVAPTLEKGYRDIIGQSLIPSWERVCGQMFQQINDTFTKGTKEYTASVETYMERQRRVQEKGKDLIGQMQAVSDSMKGNADKLTDTLGAEIHKQFKSMQEKLAHSLKEIVSQEVKQGFKNQASVIEDSVINAVRSRAVTPSPHADPHLATIAQIQQCLAKRNYDEGFQLALSAENLNFVIFVCERVDVSKIFGDKCLLSQSVILALIQQLSMELHKNSETKLNFIQAAFLALAPDSPQTKHFIPKVLKDLLKQLGLFMQTNPPLKQMTDARLLKMAVENMLGK